MKIFPLFLIAISFSLLPAWAQERVISGTIRSSEDDSGIPGASVMLKGTTSGTITDVEGNYRLNVPSEGGVLVFSFVGMKSQEENVGQRSVIDVSLDSDVTQLSEVVVTAQGIARKKEALGFALSTVDKGSIEDRTEGDVTRSLRSKVPGMQITQQSGLSGSGTNILIRGYSSITGDNQPLFIVDGVPFNTSNNNAAGDGDGNDFMDGTNLGSSRFLDLDPSNIEEISVLRGFAAATLYGAQGRNGVILVTTKAGSQGGSSANTKSSISVTQSLFVNEIASLPDYQDSFGNGFDQVFGWFFSNWGPSFKKDGLAGWGADATIDDDGNLPHPYSNFSNLSLRAAFPQFQKDGAEHKYPYKPYNSVENFFRKGLVSNTSVNAVGVSKDGNSRYSAGFGFLRDEGFTPGNELERMSFSLGGSTKLSNGIKINGTMNLVRTDYLTPPISASQGNGAFNTRPGTTTSVRSSLLGHIFFTPRSIDMLNLPYEHPITKESVYYRAANGIQHPLWTLNNAFSSQLTNRIYGTLGVVYDIMENLNLAYRVGYDIYNESNESGQHKGGIDGPANGYYTTFNNVNTIWDHTLSVNGDYQIGEDVGLNFNVGLTARRSTLSRQGVRSTNQLVHGTFRHFNFSNAEGIQFFRERNILGVFGQVEGSYKDYVFLTLAARNDEVSNFPQSSRSLFYPSVSASVLLSEIVPSLSTINVNLLKLRVGYGTSAGFRTGYPTSSVLDVNSRNYINPVSGTVVSANTTGGQLGNPNLKPERQQEFELGLEARGWDNRVTVDLSWYTRTSTDLIIDRPLDPSTGYTSTFENIGKVVNVGIELDLGVDIIKTSRVIWNARANLTHNKSEVKDIGTADKISTSGFTNLGNFAVVGEPLGVILGSRIKRDPDGQYIVNSAGRYDVDTQIAKIGDPNPDFTFNITNSLKYKNFTLSAVFNWVQGGDIYSTTIATLIGRGLTTDTEDRLQTYILPGVKNTGTAANPVYEKNDIQINNSSYYFSNVAFGPDELQIYDATAIRLQELSLSYSLPKSVLNKTPFGSVTITASGYNLWYSAVNTPPGTNFDPNVAGLGVGNGQGFDYLNGPSSRRYGATLKCTF